MDLHCYATTPLGQSKRLGIYLKQAQDVYFRLRSHETTTAELASRSPLPRPIYLATIVDESIEVPRGVFGNNDNRIISIKLPMDTPSYRVHSIRAVPELYWQRHLGCFSIGRLSNFTCFVRFAVTSRVAPHEQHYKNSGEETTSLILVCDLADASNFQMSLYAQTGLQNSVKPPRFIDPFTRIDDYGPLGDPFSLLILRPDGIEERRVKMMHQDQGLNYVVSATLDSSQKSVFIAKIAVSPPMGEAPAQPHPLMQGRQQIGDYRRPAQMIYQLPREALSVAPPRNDAYAERNGYRHGNVPVFPLGAYAYEEPDDYHFRELASVAPPQNYQRNEANNYPRGEAASVATPTNYALIPREQREREMPSVAPPQDDGFRDHPWK
ncbi:hypothetical protein GQ53DRAFT_747410 [Thozetella sp. PMI_491]|nr:hypothetical protein GQ53DRAFT_747410 [Thozetella sp. PMI_491]